MKKTIIFILLFIGTVVLRGQTTDLTHKIDSLIGNQIMSETPGGVIGVVKDGKVLYKKIFGLANLDYRIPVTDSTVFNLASVSKQFTAFLVLLLEKKENSTWMIPSRNIFRILKLTDIKLRSDSYFIIPQE